MANDYVGWGLILGIEDSLDDFINDATEVVNSLGTGLPPRDLAAFSSQSTEDGIKLTFTPPAQTYIDDGGTNQFAVMPAGVLIRYSDTGYPRTPDEGKFGYDYKPTGDWVTTSQECTIVGLTKDTKYYFTAFPYSTEHVYNKNQVTANRTEMTWVGNKGTISVTVNTPEGYEGTLGEYTITLVDQASDSPQNVEKTATGAGLTQFGGLEGGKQYKVQVNDLDDLLAPPLGETLTVVGGQNIETTVTYITKYGNVTVNVSLSPSNLKFGSYTVTLVSQDGGSNVQQTRSGAGSVTFNNLEHGKTYIATLTEKNLCTANQSSLITVVGGTTVSANASYTFNFNKTFSESTWPEIRAVVSYGVAGEIYNVGDSKSASARRGLEVNVSGGNKYSTLTTKVFLVNVDSNGDSIFCSGHGLFSTYAGQWVGGSGQNISQVINTEFEGEFFTDSDFVQPDYVTVTACGQKTGTTTNKPQSASVKYFPPTATMIGFASSVNGTESPGFCSYFTNNTRRKLNVGAEWSTCSLEGDYVTASTHEYVGVSTGGTIQTMSEYEANYCQYGWPICFMYKANAY